jgi:hypothetical protein
LVGARRSAAQVREAVMAQISVAQPSQYAVPAEAAARPVPRPWTGKLLAAAFSVAVIGAMLSAVVQNWSARPRDSFPLSYFPMFSYEFDDPHTEHYVAGWDGRGNRWAIHYSHIAPGGSLVRIRRETVRAMVRRGQSAQLCRNVARRIAERNPSSLRSLVSLEVVTGSFSLSEYLRGNKAPLSETVHATCAIER